MVGGEVGGQVDRHVKGPLPGCPRGRAELFTAGFPCQPFSQNGRHLGESDDRGGVIKDIIKYLKRAQPWAFVLENVP
eukprot:2186296-Pyramimonas_sp.AAC.1